MMKQVVAVLLACLALSQARDWSRVFPVDRLYSGSLGDDLKITGGNEVVPHSLPYQVALFIPLPDGSGTAFCGGSLISDEWVMTAAHCAEISNSFEVVLGAHDIGDETEPTQVHYIATEKVIHPEWVRLFLLNDIALIKLPEKAQLNENINTIRLPSRLQLETEDFAGQIGRASGWGLDSDNSSTVTNLLNEVLVPVLSNEACVDGFGPLGDSMPIYNTTICIDTNGGKSICSGDSGGPLAVPEADELPTVIGISSFVTIFGCEVGIPAGLTRTTHYIDWIFEVTGIPVREN